MAHFQSSGGKLQIGTDVTPYIGRFIFDPEDIDYTQFGSRAVPYELDTIVIAGTLAGGDLEASCTAGTDCRWHSYWPEMVTLDEVVEACEEHLATAHPEGYETTFTGLTEGATITVKFEGSLEIERVVRVVRRERNEDGTTTYHFDPA